MPLTMQYDDLLRAAEWVEANGGFMRDGDDFNVDGRVISGEDRVEFALILSRRAAERATGGEKLAFRQGFVAGKRQVLAAILNAAKTVEPS